MALRYIQSHKSFAVINIFGLAIGIASAVIIFLVIHYEYSYDGYQSHKDQICRVVTTYKSPSTGEVKAQKGGVAISVPEALRNDFPQLKGISSVWNIGGAQIHIPVPGKDISAEKKIKVNEGLFFAEPSLFTMFDFNWLSGNAQRLNEPNTVVLSESLANIFFGNWQIATGRTIQLWSFRIPLLVTGIFKDLPSNTDMEVKLGASYSTFKNLNSLWFGNKDWEQVPWNNECFVLIPPGSQPSQYNKELESFVLKYFPKAALSQNKITLSLQPLMNMHLNESFNTFKGDALTHKEIGTLELVGFFLLLVACINFINLATAQSLNRAREIGVRKVLGSNRSQVLFQFLGETGLITLVSFLISIILAYLTLPFIRILLGKPIFLNISSAPSFLFFLPLLFVLITCLAGFYPALVLSAFRPIEAIKNKLQHTTKGISVRRGLVVFQFVIAQLLIIGTIVVLQQMHFFRSQPMGFDKNAVAFVELPSDSTDQTKYSYLKEQILKIPGIESASFCLDAPASFGSNYVSFYLDGENIKKDFSANLQFADTSYLHTFKIPLQAGRLPFPSDTLKELLVNETFVKKLGFNSTTDIIGKTISFDQNKHIPLTIVGVMHDFNSKSLKEPITPFILGTFSHGYNFIAFRLNPTHIQSTLNLVERTFSGIYPTYIYDLNFLDDRISHFYTSEAMAADLFKMAAFLAIFISCLGLYGLISFMAIQKIKEVGIRKVLGASIKSIVYLFSREFTILIVIAFLISAPLGYLFMYRWLSGFYYHINLNILVFILALMISITIAWLTVGYKAVKAALANPVKSLKSE